MAVALSKNLELATIDIKDAYLNASQKAPVVIEVEASLLGDGQSGVIPYILERLLPGQRVAASEWFNFMKEILDSSGLHGFVKEPTLFRHSDANNNTSLVLHADDGLVMSTPEERRVLVAALTKRVKVQVGDPLKLPGDELEFLKRKYVKTDEGIIMFSSRKHLDALVKAFEGKLRERDTPADNSFLEPDTSKPLGPKEAKLYKESVGRLLYLSHTRPDIQFSTCILSSKMASPTSTSMRWWLRVVGYLLRVPCLGFKIKPISDGAGLDSPGRRPLGPSSKVLVESITDADWAGCKRTRRSRSSVGGSLVSSMVRSQRSIALSSGESEFIALVSGAGESLYVKECLEFLIGDTCEVAIKLRTDSAACRGISQRLGCGRVRHLDCGLLWVQDAIKKQLMSVGVIPGHENPADVGTKPLAGPRLRELLCRMGAVDENEESYGVKDLEDAEAKRELNRAIKNGAFGVKNLKKVMPILLILSQISGVEGLSLATGAWTLWLEDAAVSILVATAVGFMFIACTMGIPAGVALFLKWLWRRVCNQRMRDASVQTQFEATETHQVGIQADQGMSRMEQHFINEYVERVTFLESALHEEHQVVVRCERALHDTRGQIRALENELVRALSNAVRVLP